MKQSVFSQFIFHDVSTWPDYIKWLAIILTNVVFFSGVYVYILQVNFVKSYDLQIENNRLKNTIFQKKQKIQQKDFYQNQLHQMKVAWKTQAEQLLNINDVANIITEINNIGLENHLQFKTIHALPERKQKKLIVLPIEIQVTGEYLQLAQFFLRLSQLTRSIELNDFALTLNEDSVAQRLHLSFTMNVLANKVRKNVTVNTGKNIIVKQDPFQIENEKQDLKNFSLETLRYVGYLQQQENFWALIAAPNEYVYQAKIGTEIGKQNGKIIHIDASNVEIIIQAIDGKTSKFLNLNKNR